MTEASLALDWAAAFAVTLAVELMVAVPALGAAAGNGLLRRALLVGLAQLSTHPIVWFVLPALLRSRGSYLVTAELFACGVEATLYVAALPGLSPRRAVGASLAANVASVAVGLALRGLGLPV